MRCGLLIWALLVGGTGCMSAAQRARDESPLETSAVRVTLLRERADTHQLQTFQQKETLHASEPLTIDLTVSRPAYVALVLHAASGESESLLGDGKTDVLMAFGTTRRYVVPRRAPPGVREKELRLFAVASSQPLSESARSLLRLPCGSGDDGGRGDRTKEESKQSGRSSSDSSDSSSGKPAEGKRKGPGDLIVCASPPGLFAPLSVIPIVVASE